MIENLFGGGGGGGTVDTITAGTGISVDSTDPANPIITNTSLNTDETAKVSSNDTTAGYLNGKLVAGTGVTFTESNDGGNETLTIAAAGGVTGFTGSQNTASPNNTVNASRLLVNATSIDADFVAQPKGAGALLAQLPDSTSVGGNKRGARSVDFSLSRLNASDVASGIDAVVIGSRNKAAGNTSTAIGYGVNTNAADSVALGTGNTRTFGQYAVAVGNNSSAQGASSLAMGSGASAIGSNSIAIGTGVIASSTYSIAIGGFSWAPNSGMVAHASGMFVSQGDAQREEYVLRRTTTDATQTELTADGGAGSSVNRIAIVSDSAYAFSALVVGRATASDNNSAGYKIEGVIDNNAGTTAFVGTPTVTVLGEDTAGWDVVAVADNTNNALVIRVTGTAATNIRWVASVRLVRVTG